MAGNNLYLYMPRRQIPNGRHQSAPLSHHRTRTWRSIWHGVRSTFHMWYSSTMFVRDVIGRKPILRANMNNYLWTSQMQVSVFSTSKLFIFFLLTERCRLSDNSSSIEVQLDVGYQFVCTVEVENLHSKWLSIWKEALRKFFNCKCPWRGGMIQSLRSSEDAICLLPSQFNNLA